MKEGKVIMDSEVEKIIRTLLKKASEAKNVLELKIIETEIEKKYIKYNEMEEIAVAYLRILNRIKKINDEELLLQELENKGESIYKHHEKSEEVALEYLKFLLSAEVIKTDDFLAKELFKKGKEIYKKHQKSEKVAWQYFWLLKKVKWISIENSLNQELVKQGERIYKDHEKSEVIVLEYLDFLRLLCDGQEEDFLLQDLLRRGEEAYHNGRKSIKLAQAYLRLLSMIKIGLFESIQFQELIKRGNEVYKDYQESEDVAFEYLRFYLYVNFDQLDETQIQSLLKEVDEIYQKYHESKKVARTYLKILSKVKNRQDKEFVLNELVKRGDEVYERHHKSSEIAEWYLSFLWRLDWPQNEDLLLHESLKRGEKVYSQHQNSESVVFNYFRFLWNLDMVLDGETLSQEILIKADTVYKKHITSEKVNLEYLNFLFRFSRFKTNQLLLEKIANKAKKVYEQATNSSIVTFLYFSFLLEMYRKNNKVIRLEEIEKKAENLYLQEKMGENHKEISSKYGSFLVDLSYYKDNLYDIKKISQEIEKIYKKDPSFINLIMYVRILNIMSRKSHNSSEIKRIVNKVNKIRGRMTDRPMVQRINEYYIQILSNLSLKQNKKSLLEETVIEAKRIYERNNGYTIAANYIRVLLNWALSQKDMSKIESITEEIIKIHGKNKLLRNKVEIFIDEMLMTKMNAKKHRENFSRLLYSFFIQDNDKNPLRYSKYDGLLNLVEKKAKKGVNQLIEIFSLVQIIKNQLIVKNPEKLRFGHYTTGEVLQKYLKQEDEEPYAIRVKSRLNNVDYMNDPSEGKVLNQYLQLDLTDQKLYLKPTPWFLMSLTTAVDKLTMWAQYGDNAKGVCLVLKSSDFAKVYQTTDIKQLKNNQESDDTEQEERITNENEKTKDVIYRIGYISPTEETDALLEKKHNTCLSEDEISTLNKSLENLKRQVEHIDKNTKLYEAIDECLEEIRYLFKSTDYSYEAELRLLKYSPLESDNKNIKINDSGEVAKIYIERDNPIKIAEVIFGPKFPTPQNVTPLLYLLDKNIKFSQSKIPFK